MYSFFLHSSWNSCSSHQDHLYKVFRIGQSECELYINLNLYFQNTHIFHTLRHNWARPERFTCETFESLEIFIGSFKEMPFSSVRNSQLYAERYCAMMSWEDWANIIIWNIYIYIYIFEFQYFSSVSAAVFLNAFY